MVRFFSPSYNFYPKDYPPNLYQFSPQRGMIFTPNYKGVHKSGEFEVIFDINSEGFRSSQEFVIGGQDQKIIAVLGDSMAAGLEVDEEKTFVRLLESKLIDSGIKQVQNYGMSNAETSYYLQAYKYYARQHNPYLVIISIVYNDFDLPFSAYASLAEVDKFLKNYSALYRFAYLQYERNELSVLHNFPKDGYAYEYPENEDFKKLKERFFDNLSQLVYEIKNDGAIPIIFLEPSSIESSDDAWKDLEESYASIGGKGALDRDKIRKALQAFANQTGIEFIDPTDAFREAYKSGTILHYPNDRHFNEVGHKIAAEKISPKIKEILR